MRIAAILFIVVTLTINFVYNNLSSLVLAMFSFPVLLWLLRRKKKRKTNIGNTAAVNAPERSVSAGLKD
ncbi:MAG TPA: hypothetical protein VGB71_11010 [Flavisolibacter sp.]|jgi:Flp pilus assembly protein TadB